MSNFPIKIGNTSGIDTYVGTLTNGEEQLLITRDGKQYLSKGDGTKIELSDFEIVPSLPLLPLNKIYILPDYSMNYYDTSWHTLGGNQIIPSTTAPIDTTKLWLDITDKTKLILKWFDSTTTSWININSTSSDATSLNGVDIDDSTRAVGRVLIAEQGKNTWGEINIAGVVGSATTYTVSDVTLNANEEKIFNHPESVNIVPSIEEQVTSSSVTDTHVDFSDNTKYSFQDSGKIILNNNKAELDIYTKLLMHMDDSNFTDVCGHAITNHNVTLDTTNKVFGSGSAKFNGSSNIKVTKNSNLDLSISNYFTIHWNQYLTNRGLYDTPISFGSGAYRQLSLGCGSYGFNLLCGNGSTYIVNGSGGTLPTLNAWHHLAIVRNGNIFTVYIDGVSQFTVNYSGSLYTTLSDLYIGGNTSEYITGNIDEVNIVIGKALWTTNFTPPIQATPTPYLVNNTPTYLKTTGMSNFSLTTIDSITSLTIPVTTPTNTSVKCLFSVDNGVNWLYYDGTSIHKFTGDLTLSWSTTSSSYIQLQTLFTNLSMTTFASMLSSLSIVPVSLDFAFQLNTTDLTVTPSVSAITMVYVNIPHNEFVSHGKYNDTYTELGVKRISNNSLAVKNKTSNTKIIKLSIVTSV